MARSSGDYHFSMQRPSQREIDEETDQQQAGRRGRRAKVKGEQAPVRPRWISVRGKQALLPGQWLCESCPNAPRSSGRSRDRVTSEC